MDFNIIIDAFDKALNKKDYKLETKEIGNTIFKYSLKMYGDRKVYNEFETLIHNKKYLNSLKKIKGLECICIAPKYDFHYEIEGHPEYTYGYNIIEIDENSFWLELYMSRYKASKSIYHAIRNVDFNSERYSFLKADLMQTKNTKQTNKYLEGDPDLGKILDCVGCIKIENSSHIEIINDILDHYGELYFSALCRAILISAGGWGIGFNIPKTTYKENFKYDPKSHEISFKYRMYNSAWKEL